MIVDGKRLTESERLTMLAQEEHLALESMFYEHHAGDSRPSDLLATLLSIPAPVVETQVEGNAREAVKAVKPDAASARELVRDCAQTALLSVA
jgi:hypothetical protein